ncbi:hypothetical protein ANAPC5_00757 [Anaplasma phagocytophilum]|nr:hypothetical protein ANAPC2_00701 [Anaplasma phagocytophilum]SBO32120.1 hypothetical protein ANAPC4_00704 [Anaplasma phagocytophilum]SBO32632.1 hypothetical protein ANAPC3_00929 [Anaplasma phagocytophilum]SCV64074.1 hypothetical protein ANAPC5_00757 [Anaplasma phagocytophilum]
MKTSTRSIDNNGVCLSSLSTQSSYFQRFLFKDPEEGIMTRHLDFNVSILISISNVLALKT